MFAGPSAISFNRPRGAEAAALGLWLVPSALLTAMALRAPEYHWLAWISFLPLFVAVRSLRPLSAALYGGLWGACLYAFSTAGPMSTEGFLGIRVGLTSPALVPSTWGLALLTVIPAVYAGLAALPGRAIVFRLLMLALGWTLVEAGLHFHRLLGPHDGPLTGLHAEGPYLHWLARLLGYVCTAFLVASVNVSLIGILTGARLHFPLCRSLVGVHNATWRIASQVILVIQSLAVRQAHPRAPPIQLAATS